MDTQIGTTARRTRTVTTSVRNQDGVTVLDGTAVVWTDPAVNRTTGTNTQKGSQQ